MTPRKRVFQLYEMPMKLPVNLLIVCMFFSATAVAAEKDNNPPDAPEAAFWHDRMPQP
jgi:hypothetical protein